MSVDDVFDRLLAGARADDAARSRAAVGALRNLADEETTVPGVLADLADHGGRLRIDTRSACVSGTVEALYRDGVILRSGTATVLIRTEAIVAVTCPGGHRFDGDERRTSTLPWVGLLLECIEHDDTVTVAASDTAVRGRVRTIGRESLVLDTAEGATVYVRTASIDVVTLGATRSPAD